MIAQCTRRLGAPDNGFRAFLVMRHADGFNCDDVVPLLAAMPEV